MSRRARSRLLRVTATLAVLTLTSNVGPLAYAAIPSTRSAAAPTANIGTSVTGMTPVPVKHVGGPTATDRSFVPAKDKSTWPAASSSTLDLAAPSSHRAAQAGTKALASGTPVWAQAVASSQGTYTGPSSVKVSVQPKSLATKLGVSGVVWSLGAAAGRGSVRVGLDYSSFSEAIGGNYASRLRLVELPACALTTPQLAKCQVQTPLTSVNTTANSSVSALVTLGSATATSTQSASRTSSNAALASAADSPSGETVLGATDSTGQEGGEGGSYAQDGLSASGSWAQSGSSGDFTYTYNVALPSSSSSLTPDADLSYDSGSVDGSTSTSEAQASWAGDGWGTQDSYIQQTFTPCDDDPEGAAGEITTTDECYAGQLLTVSLDGTSAQLVDDGGTYRLSDDPGAIVTKVTGADNDTKTFDTSYWKITEQDGTSYYFGQNQLPGYSSTADPVDHETNSVDYERVYSAHDPSDKSGDYSDPCYNSTPADSYCTMAYKWHLDYVVDAKSQAMAYYYDQATNYYAADAGADNGANSIAYIRDSYLAETDYGFTTATGPYGTIPDKVVYSTGLRCEPATLGGTADCGSGETSSNSADYPDVPFDLVCTAGATCSAQAPGFFSTVALTSITTEQYSGGSYNTVDSYALTETEPTTGDATSSTLWLAQIQRTAEDTTAGSSTTVQYPPIQFEGKALANRVDTSSLPTNFRFRLVKITNETGGVIGVTYSLPTTCSDSYVEAQTAASAASNTESCFPVYWTPLGYSSPLMDWFEKYAVTQVLETDTTGGSLTKETDYAYNYAAWHYDDDPTVKAKYRTYGQWRGYESVTTNTGELANDPQTKSVTLYYQGMDGDWLSSTTTRTVSLTDSQGGVHTDTEQLSGDVLETEAYLGDGGPLDHFAIDSYWVSPAVATQDVPGLPALTSNATGTAEVYSGQHLTDGGESTWRYNETDTTYDATTSDANFGLPDYSYSHTVPVSSAYDRCTTTTYTAANTALNIVGLAGMTETDAIACSGFTEDSEASQPSALNTLGAPSSLTRPGDVVSATEILYDGASAITTAPVQGLVTKKLTATGYTSGAWDWQATSTVTYDTPARFLRPLTTTDADGNTTTLAYTLNSANLTTGETSTNALDQATAETLDPERGLTLTSTDPNGVVTTDWYDAAGNVIDEWDDSRPTSSDANKIYTYTVSNTSVSGEVVQTLDEELVYTSTVTIVDSLGRARQTQTTTPQGGRLITDETYDSRGWAEKKNNAYWDSGTSPTLSLEEVPDNESPNQDDYTYNGLGQVVYDQSNKDASVVSTTTTVYNGDSTTVIPPTGGVEKTTVTDPIGRTSKVEEYSTDPTLTTPSNVATGIFYLTGGTAITTTTGYGFDTTSTDATYGDAYTTTTDAKSDVWTSYTNLAGNVAEKKDPTAGVSTMTYDTDGNLRQTEDSRGDYVSYTYDALNRKTAEYAAAYTARVAYTSTSVPGNETASWVYDSSSVSDSIGHLTTETSYSGGYAYVLQYTGFNAFGESLGEKITIPESSTTMEPLAGTYTIEHSYYTNTGLPFKDAYTAAGTLSAEIVLHTYSTALDLPTGESGGGYGYLNNVTYDAWSRPVLTVLGSATNGTATIADTYDAHTGNLTDQLVTRQTDTPTDVDDTQYFYDLASNITKQIETRLGSSSDTETQCYTYDALDQLTTAWTATDSCATAPTTASHSQVANTLGNSSAYWESWTYDSIGNRLTQDQHATGTATKDTVTTDTYSTTQPSTLTSTATTGASTSSTSYAYDTAGNTKTRDTSAGDQTLTWNNNGTLAQDANTTKSTSTSYVYDADGNLLLQLDPTTTTLYLENEQLTLTNGSGSVAGTRYYPLPAGATAVRTGADTDYTFEIANQQATGDLDLDYTAQTPTWRQFDPYGNARGTAVTWIDNRTVMDKPTDTTTGLTDDGARYLDTTIGRFISLDPLFEPGDTLALGGYSYTDDNPVTQDDPTGMDPGEYGTGVGGSAPDCDANCQANQVTPQDLAASGVTISKTSTKSLKAKITQETHHERALKNFLTELKDCQEVGGFGVADCEQQSVTNFEVMDGQISLEEALVELLADLPLVLLADGEDPVEDESVDTLEREFTELIGKDQGQAIDAAVSNEIDATEGEISTDDAALACATQGGNSFTANTLVLTASGKAVPITSLKIGDQVATANTADGKKTSERVDAVLVHHDTDLYNLTIDTAHGKQIIHTTANHLIWDLTTHTWVAAAKLHHGDHLLTADATTATADTGTTPQNPQGWMWDLTVHTLHAFYVVAGDTPVLVHNSSCSDNLVLGSRYHGLDDLTQQLGGRNLLAADDWREQVQTAADLLKLGDTDITVSFSLDGLPGETPDGILHQAVVADMRGIATPTQWELATMKYAGVLDKVNWYQGGDQISNPFG